MISSLRLEKGPLWKTEAAPASALGLDHESEKGKTPNNNGKRQRWCGLLKFLEGRMTSSQRPCTLGGTCQNIELGRAPSMLLRTSTASMTLITHPHQVGQSQVCPAPQQQWSCQTRRCLVYVLPLCVITLLVLVGTSQKPGRCGQQKHRTPRRRCESVLHPSKLLLPPVSSLEDCVILGTNARLQPLPSIDDAALPRQTSVATSYICRYHSMPML